MPIINRQAREESIQWKRIPDILWQQYFEDVELYEAELYFAKNSIGEKKSKLALSNEPINSHSIIRYLILAFFTSSDTDLREKFDLLKMVRMNMPITMQTPAKEQEIQNLLEQFGVPAEERAWRLFDYPQFMVDIKWGRINEQTIRQYYAQLPLSQFVMIIQFKNYDAFRKAYDLREVLLDLLPISELPKLLQSLDEIDEIFKTNHNKAKGTSNFFSPEVDQYSATAILGWIKRYVQNYSSFVPPRDAHLLLAMLQFLVHLNQVNTPTFSFLMQCPEVQQKIQSLRAGITFRAAQIRQREADPIDLSPHHFDSKLTC